MELTYNELKKRDVVNVVDGKCFGKIVDLTLDFPKGKLRGITVPHKKSCKLLGIFDKSTVYIREENIIKIGGDVILVKLKCGETCSTNVPVGLPKQQNSPCSPCGTNLNGDSDDFDSY